MAAVGALKMLLPRTSERASQTFALLRPNLEAPPVWVKEEPDNRKTFSGRERDWMMLSSSPSTVLGLEQDDLEAVAVLQVLLLLPPFTDTAEKSLSR